MGEVGTVHQADNKAGDWTGSDDVKSVFHPEGDTKSLKVPKHGNDKKDSQLQRDSCGVFVRAGLKEGTYEKRERHMPSK